MPGRAEEILVGADATHIDVAAHADALEDPEGTFALADVQRPEVAARFSQIGPRGLAVGYTRAAWWVRATVRNTSTYVGEWLLSLPAARLDHSALYLETPEGVAVYRSGVLVPLAQRQMGGATAAYRFALTAHATRTLWLRVQSVHMALVVPLQLWRAGYLAAGQARDFVLLGLLLGVIAYLLVAVVATAHTAWRPVRWAGALLQWAGLRRAGCI